MKRYKQVPQWWYLVLLVGSMGLSLMMSFVWKDDVQIPWWGLIFAFCLAWVVTLPIGVIQATTNQVINGSFFPVNRNLGFGGSRIHIFSEKPCSNPGMT